jgi:hypothetical protein
MDVLQGFQTSQVWQTNIEEDDVRPLPGNERQTLGCTACCENRKPQISEDLTEGVANQTVIIDD